jgi:hypothetical protein
MAVTPKQVNNWIVSHETEKFRIFPKNRAGESIPVWRHNIFLNLRHARTGDVVVFKHYLHQKAWLWRDSREQKPVDEVDVLREVARMLGVGRKTAEDVVLAAKVNGVIPHGVAVAEAAALVAA